MSGVYEFRFEVDEMVVRVRFTGAPMITLDECEALGKVDSLSRRKWAREVLKVVSVNDTVDLDFINKVVSQHNRFALVLLEEKWIRGSVTHSLTDLGILLTVHRLHGNLLTYLICIYFLNVRFLTRKLPPSIELFQ